MFPVQHLKGLNDTPIVVKLRKTCYKIAQQLSLIISIVTVSNKIKMTTKKVAKPYGVEIITRAII